MTVNACPIREGHAFELSPLDAAPMYRHHRDDGMAQSGSFLPTALVMIDATTSLFGHFDRMPHA